MQNTSNMQYKIIEKQGFKIVKINKNKFNLTFDISNQNIILPQIINFDLIKLIYTLNSGVFEMVKLEKNNEHNENNELIVYSLLKDIYEDLGLSQLYLYATIKQIDTQDNTVITFTCNCSDKKLSTYPDDAEYLRVDNILIQFHIINNHFILVNCDINLLEKHNIPIFGEKIIGNIIHNIFKNVKQFIENISF